MAEDYRNDYRELRDRVIRLELGVAANSQKLDKVSKQTCEMHELLLQAKGARWAVLGFAALVGFLLSKATGWVEFLGFSNK